MKTTKRNISWTDTPDGNRKYREARAKAQAEANADGFDRGLRRDDFFKDYVTFFLPRKENRRGFELRCEVVSCMDLTHRQPGHGP